MRYYLDDFDNLGQQIYMNMPAYFILSILIVPLVVHLKLG